MLHIRLHELGLNVYVFWQCESFSSWSIDWTHLHYYNQHLHAPVNVNVEVMMLLMWHWDSFLIAEMAVEKCSVFGVCRTAEN